MTPYEQERNGIREKIWSLMHVHKGNSVLDVGVGHLAYSLTKLKELGITVTAIDLNLDALRKHKTTDARFVRCNAAWLPFRNSTFDLAIANFTVHEIEPSLHQKVFSELCRVAQRGMVVEPAPGRDRLYRSYQQIWTDAMHSTGQFEDCATIEHWSQLMRNCGARIILSQAFSSRERLIGQEASEYMKSAIEIMEEEGVSPEHIVEMQKLRTEIETKGMVFSDINVIVGQTNP
jgi:ubiquinone/menaquinone biosynthesis C-methylase UbiE